MTATVTASAVLAAVGFTAYAAFFSQTVPTPIGVTLAAFILPTGDIIRFSTRWIAAKTPKAPER